MLCNDEKALTCSSVRQVRIQRKTSKSVERLMNYLLALYSGKDLVDWML